jgi:hypothetical protein
MLKLKKKIAEYKNVGELIFYNRPTFIEFCVQEMKVSAEFELFCQKWNEN